MREDFSKAEGKRLREVRTPGRINAERFIPQWESATPLRLILKKDERLDYSVKFLVHHLECLRHLVKAKAMGGQQGRVNAASFHQAEQAFHSQPSTWTQTGADRLFRHSDSPIEPWYTNELTLAVITSIG